MGVTLTDVLLFGKAQSDDVDNATLVIYRRNIMRWSAIGGYLDIIVKGVAPLSLPDAIANSLSYVKAFGGTEQRDIPDNYLQRQFIYMMDGSYLLTDIVLTYDGRIEMDFQTTTMPSGSVYLLGGRTETYGGLFFAKGGSGTVLVDSFGDTSADRYTSSVSLSNNTRYKFTFNNKVATLESGGTTLFTNTSTGEKANGAALCINGLNSSGTISGAQTGIYLYSFKVWNAQGELIANYVPAVEKAAVPVVGFYDTVSKTFKTATAGTFAAGGEAVPTPDKPMDIVSNNGVLRLIDNDLPSDCTRLQYITLSGNSYFDSGIVPNTYDYNIETKAAFDVLTGGPNCAWGYMGSSSNLPRWVLGTYGSGYLINANTTSSVSGADTNEHIFNAVIYDNNGVPYWQSYIDGEQRQNFTLTSTETWEANTLPIYIGARNNNGTVGNFAEVKIYYHKVTKGDTVIQHLIPCKKADDTLAFYDIVTGAFFTNQGSGTFVAGPVDYSHTHIGADGTVETINVHGKNLFDQSTATRYRTSWSNGGGGAWQAVSSSSEAVAYGSYVKPNTTYTLSKKGGSRLIITGFRTKTEPSLSATPADYQIQINTTEIVDGSYTFTTPADCTWILFGLRQNNSTPTFPYDVQLEQGATATDYVPYYDGGTATAEMLLKVGDYQDVQSIIDGVVTRNVGVLVLDGTENWNTSTLSACYSLVPNLGVGNFTNRTVLCTHFKNSATLPSASDRQGYALIGNAGSDYTVGFGATVDFPTTTAWNSYLATQYAAGTPVIVIYPLATPTTESVTGQTLQVTDGDNTLEITQASLDGLELEAKYQAAVSLTIQEVQDANLDPNVEVTIN